MHAFFAGLYLIKMSKHNGNNKSNQSHNQVVYQPLTNLGINNEVDQLEQQELDDELEVISSQQQVNRQQVNGRTQSPKKNSRYIYSHKQHGRPGLLIGLRQLRTLLLLLAFFLFVIFMLKLATYKENEVVHLQLPANETSLSNNSEPKVFKSVKEDQQLNFSQASYLFGPLPASSRLYQTAGHYVEGASNNNKSIINTGDTGLVNDRNLVFYDNKPKYDGYLSSIIYERDHKALGLLSQSEASEIISDDESVLKNGNNTQSTGQLLDDFNYSLGDDRTFRKFELSSQVSPNKYKWWTFGLRTGRFVTVTNYIRAMKSFTYNSTITLATQITPDYESFHHTLELCERWDGPISVAVFLSRGLNELPVIITLIKFVRQCLPAPLSACMRDKISWHLVFAQVSLKIEALSSSLSYPKYHLDAINYSSFANTEQCPKLAASSANEIIRQFQSDIIEKNKRGPISADSKVGHEENVPRNVLLNVARSTARSKFILATNVDVYPSIQLVDNFVKLIVSEEILYTSLNRSIFVLPTFEVFLNLAHQAKDLNPEQQQVPKTKHELVEMISAGKVTLYREPDCDRCHEFPRQNDWLNADEPTDLDVNNYRQHSRLRQEGSDNFSVFEIVTRNSSTSRWSPYFVALNNYRNYNENYLLNERTDVMYEMCLLNYRMIILNNAFLVRVITNSTVSSAEAPELNDGVNHGAQEGRRKSNEKYIEMSLRNLKQRYNESENVNKC